MNAVCTYNHIDFTDDVLLNRPETQPTQYGRDTTQISSWGVCAKLGKKMRVTWISDKSLLQFQDCKQRLREDQYQFRQHGRLLLREAVTEFA